MASKIIKSLTQANDNMQRVENEASASLQKATDEAVSNVQKKATDAISLVHGALDKANKEIVETAKQSMRKLISEEEAGFVDMTPLKKNWGKPKK